MTTPDDTPPQSLEERTVAAVLDGLRRAAEGHEQRYGIEGTEFTIVFETGGACTILHSYVDPDRTDTPDIAALQITLGAAAIQAARTHGGVPAESFEFPEDPEALGALQGSPDELWRRTAPRFHFGARIGGHMVFQQDAIRLIREALQSGRAEYAESIAKAMLDGGAGYRWVQGEIEARR